MASEALHRLRSDVETLQAATGLDFPYRLAHVRTAYVFAIAACAAAVFAWFGRGLDPVWRVAAEVAFVFVPVSLYAYLRKISVPGDARQARQISGVTPLSFAIALGSVALVGWLARIQAIRGAYAMLFVGAVWGSHCLTLAARDRRLRSWYLAAFGSVALPVIYLLTGLPLDLLVMVGLAGGGAGQGLVWRSQLRALGRCS